MANLETQLAGLLDREAIRDLPLRYCDCIWRDDLRGVLDLFAPDGAFIIKNSGGETAARGQEELERFYSGGTEHDPRPYIHNHVVELLGADRASGRCYLDLRSAKNNMEWLGAGFYEDDYVKLGDSWKFASRLFHVVRIDAGPGSED